MSPAALEEDFGNETTAWKSFASGGNRDDHDSRLPVPVPRNETGLTRRERRLKEGGNDSNVGRLVGMGAGALVILALLIFGGIKLFGTEETPDLAEQSKAGDYVSACTLETEGVGCVSEPACFDGAFAATDCDAAHQWEAYATGRLPEGVTDADGARADATVAAACVDAQAEGGPLSQLIGGDSLDWTTDVYVSGDGTFQCVAQLKDGAPATGTMFAREAA